MKKLSSEQFIKKARYVHGDAYEYSMVEYKNNRTKIKILCSEHGIFEQTPDHHLAGRGCDKCAIAKRKQTNIERYGVENPSQCKEVQNKRKKTNLERFGVENPSQSQKVQAKKEQTNIERFGVWNPKQKHYSPDTIKRLNSFEYLHEEYIGRHKNTTQIAKELNVNRATVCDYLRKHNIPVSKKGKYSKLAIQWLEYVMAKEGVYIQHARNGGEYNIPGTRLLADGYCSSTNTVYEFYGDCFHGNLDLYKEEDYPHPFNPNITTLELYNKTMKREERIRELGYRVKITWEVDWNSNPDRIQ